MCAECPCSWASLLRKFIATVSAMEFSYFHLGVGGDCTMAAFGCGDSGHFGRSDWTSAVN